MSKQKKHNKKPLKSPKLKSTTKVKKVLDLRSVLQSIYHDYVNLETTCKHSGICCNVACPSMNYSEFVQIVTGLWGNLSKDEKISIICTSVEYFFKNEYSKWDKDSLVKPCMLLGSDGLCKCYSDRPLNCRLYGLWPKEDYERRVDKFEAAYSQYGLKRKDLPLNTQCPYVKRVDETVPLTIDLINELFKKIDNLDKDTGGFSTLQVEQKENYRTFHDWLLLRVLGEDWLVKLTIFMLAADRTTIEDQIRAIREVLTKKFNKDGAPSLDIFKK